MDFRHFQDFVFCHRAYSKTLNPRKIFTSSFLEVLRLSDFEHLLGIMCVQNTIYRVLLDVINEHLLLLVFKVKVIKVKTVLR